MLPLNVRSYFLIKPCCPIEGLLALTLFEEFMNHNSKRTVLVLANGIEAIAGFLHEISGSDATQAAAGHRVTRAALADLAAQRINQRFAKHTTRPVK